MRKLTLPLAILAIIFTLGIIALGNQNNKFGDVFNTTSVTDNIFTKDTNDDETIYFILFHHLVLVKENVSKDLLEGKIPFDYLESYKSQAKLDDTETQFLFQAAEDWNNEFKPIDDQINAVVKNTRRQYKDIKIKSTADIPPPPEELAALWKQKDELVLKYRDILRNTCGEEKFAEFNQFAIDKIAPNIERNIFNKSPQSTSQESDSSFVPPINYGCYGYSLYDVDPNNPAHIQNIESGTVLYCDMITYYNPGIESFLFEDGTLIDTGLRKFCVCSATWYYTGSFTGEAGKTYRIQSNHWVDGYQYYSGYGHYDPYGLNYFQGVYPPPYGLTQGPPRFWIHRLYKAATTQISYTIPRPPLHLASIDRTSGVPSEESVFTAIRGTGLFGPNRSLQVSGSGVTATLGNTNPNQIELQEITINIEPNAARGERQLTLRVNGVTSNPLTFTIGDNSPQITNMTPPQANTGETVSVTISGSHFGFNPLIQIAGTGIQPTITSSSPTSITALFTVLDATTAGERGVKVKSRGYTGNGFISTPQTSDLSNSVGFEVFAPSVLKIQFKKNGIWTDFTKGSLNPLCNSSSVEFKAIPNRGSWAAGQPVWGGSANGTGETIIATFNNAGPQIISATSRNTISINAAVGQTNSPINVEWLPAVITVLPLNSGNSTTTPKPTDVVYEACGDVQNNTWKLRTKTVKIGTNIALETSGYRDPDLNPPTVEKEAAAAVRELNAYFDFGTRRWHKLSATEAHERFHDSEVKCSSEHYWGQTETAIENLTVPFSSYNNAADAIVALKANSADAKITGYETIVDEYRDLLSDEPGLSRAYAAGQIVLNSAISRVILLAEGNNWSVGNILHPNPNVSNPCYQPWKPYNP